MTPTIHHFPCLQTWAYGIFGLVATLATEVPARYAGVCENDVRLAHQCVLIVLEAQIRLPNGLRKEQFILKFPEIP